MSVKVSNQQCAFGRCQNTLIGSFTRERTFLRWNVSVVKQEASRQLVSCPGSVPSPRDVLLEHSRTAGSRPYIVSLITLWNNNRREASSNLGDQFVPVSFALICFFRPMMLLEVGICKRITSCFLFGGELTTFRLTGVWGVGTGMSYRELSMSLRSFSCGGEG